MATVSAENFSIEHVKAARALLRWNAQGLADASRVGVATVRNFESGKHINEQSRQAIFDALASAGVWMKNGGKPSVGLKNLDARK